MPTYFIRHTEDLAITDAALHALFTEGRIAVHYPEQQDGNVGVEDNASLDPNDYPANRRQPIRAFLELARDGGYVCAEYRNESHFLIGVVPPASEITLFSTPWREPDKRGRTAVLKILQLERRLSLQKTDHVALLVGRPRQGTLSRWHLVQDRVADLVEGRPAKADLESLAPNLQEVMCSEFLRLDIAGRLGLPRIQHLLLPVGRTMKDLDIVGMTPDGREVFAQVTHGSDEEAQGKLARLRGYARPERHLVLFCNGSDCRSEGEITVFPLKVVFDEFRKSSHGEQWIKMVLET